MSAGDSLGRQWTVQPQGRHPHGGEYATVHDENGVEAGYIRHVDSSEYGSPMRTVEYMYVDPAYRGQGAANALLRGVRQQTGQPFLHFPDEMTPLAKHAVARAAAEDPDGHRIFRANQQRVVKYPVRKPMSR